MIIAVEGTKGFSDYEVFMRAMGVALSTPTVDSDIQVWSLGPHKINNFTAAFCNLKGDSGIIKGNILPQVPAPTIPSAVKPLAACHTAEPNAGCNADDE